MRWLTRASLRFGEVGIPEIERGLEACALTLEDDPGAPTTYNRKRAVLSELMGATVRAGYLPANPVDLSDFKPQKLAKAIDRRRVGSVDHGRAIIGHVTSKPHATYFTVMLLAGLRPAEVAALRVEDVDLPASGWGKFWLSKSDPVVGSRWTDSGEVRDSRPLKHRGRDEVREVGMLPELVRLLRPFAVGKARGDLLLSARTGKALSNVNRSWNEARARWDAAQEQRVDEVMLSRPYALRHTCATVWLNAGVPETEVAAPLGHGVDVLLKIYAGVIVDNRSAYRERIEAAIGP